MSKPKLKRSEISALNAIIGKCKIKSVGSDLFLPLLKIKAQASTVVEESVSLLKAMYEEYGISPQTHKIIGEALGQDLIDREKKLNDDEVEFCDIKILSTDKFIALSDANPELTAAELEFLMKHLVKE